VGNRVAGGMVSAGGNRGDKGAREACHSRPQFLTVLQKHDRANISKREGGKISKNYSIVEGNIRIQGIMAKLTGDVRIDPSKAINVISVRRIFLRDVSQKWVETV
jgi:hypothetical protein